MKRFCQLAALLATLLVAAPAANAQRLYPTAVGQYGAAPSGLPNQTVTVSAWLGVKDRLGHTSTLLGNVDVYYVLSGRNILAGTLNANRMASLPGGDFVGFGSLQVKIPVAARRGAGLPLVFVYRGSTFYSPSSGSGSISVR